MAAGTVGYTGLTWPITGGVADDHGYLRFYRENYLPEIKLKAQQLQALLPMTAVEQIPTQGNPLWIDAYKRVYNSQDATASVPKIQSNATRFAEHTYQTTQTERRGIVPVFKSYPERFDWRDAGALMRAVTPGSQYLSVVRGGMAADADATFVAALDSAVIVSVAPDTAPASRTFAQDGGTDLQAEYPFAAGQAYDSTVTGAYGIDAAGRTATVRITGMTSEKVNGAVRMLRTAFAVNPGEKIYCALHPIQVEQLINDIRVASGDFNSLRPLQAGEVVTYGGVTFIPTPAIASVTSEATLDPFSLAANWPGAGNSGRYAYAFPSSAMAWGRGTTRVEMDIIPHLKHLFLISVYDEFSAVRLDGAKVIRIECANGITPAA